MSATEFFRRCLYYFGNKKTELRPVKRKREQNPSTSVSWLFVLFENTQGDPTEGTGAGAELDWWERGRHHVSPELLLLKLWKPGDHRAPSHGPGKPDVPGNGLPPEGQPLASHKHLSFPVPRFPYLHMFPGMQWPGEKETIKTICIVSGQRGPSVVLALNSPQGGCESFPAVLWGQPAGQVLLGQVQEDYLQPEKAPKARWGKPDYSIYDDSVSQRQSATTQSMAELPATPNTLPLGP